MKFFSAALAALAVGSAVAAPAHSLRADVGVPPIPCTTITSKLVHATDLPAPVTPGGEVDKVSSLAGSDEVDNVSSVAGSVTSGDVDVASAGQHANKEVIVVVRTVYSTVSTVEVKVKEHLSLVEKIVAGTETDVQALLKVLVLLEDDLQILVNIVPTLNGLVVDASKLVASDLELVLSLLVEVQALVADVQGTLKGLVGGLEQKILVVIGAQLKTCLGLVESIVGPIVKFALTVVAAVKALALGDLLELVGKITSSVNLINGLLSGLGPLLNPVFQLLPL